MLTNRDKIHSVTFLIVCVLTLGLLLPLTVGMLITFNSERGYLKEILFHYQNTTLDSLARSVEDDLVSFSPSGALDVANVALKDKRVIRVSIYSSIYDMFLVQISKETQAHQYNLYLKRKVIVKNDEEFGYVEIAVDLDWIDPIMDISKRQIIFLFFTMFVGGMLLVIPVLFFRVLRPFNRLLDQAQTLSSGDLDYSCKWKGKDEFSILGKTLESMRVKLNANFNRILEMAVTDELTGIPNRRAFVSEAQKLLELSKRYDRSVMLAIFDIDWFKSINDSFGHSVGDQVLQEFARYISNKVRKADIFARIGGEEFVLCMPETELNEAQMKLESLRREIANHVFPHGQPLTVSVGLTAGTESQDLAMIMEKADTALYQAKTEGRNRVIVSG